MLHEVPHERISDRHLRGDVMIKYVALMQDICHPRPSHIISTALKTGAPPHMIDTQLPNLWRY